MARNTGLASVRSPKLVSEYRLIRPRSGAALATPTASRERQARRRDEGRRARTPSIPRDAACRSGSPRSARAAEAGDVVHNTWNRAHLKALRVAALLAVSCSIDNPVVSAEQADWACHLVHEDIVEMLKRFSDGSVGGQDTTNNYGRVAPLQDFPRVIY